MSSACLQPFALFSYFVHIFSKGQAFHCFADVSVAVVVVVVVVVVAVAAVVPAGAGAAVVLAMALLC